MNAVVGMTGHGGWPMTVFLTPAGEPFHGGTYYPPEPRHGMPSFRAGAGGGRRGLARAARARSSGSGANVGDGAAARPPSVAPSSEPLTERPADRRHAGACGRCYDPNWGGFGGAPKFPPASAVGFLLRLHARTGERRCARDGAPTTLDGMALGGMHDLVGGGFHRYAVDADVARAALREDALRQRAARDRLPRGVRGHGRARATPRVAERHARLHAARACACPRAASRRRWTPTPTARRAPPTCGRRPSCARRSARTARRAAAYYGVTEAGQLRGRDDGAARPGGAAGRTSRRIRAALLERRLRRPQPGRDDKAHRLLERPRAGRAGRRAAGGCGRPDLLAAARDCARFLLGPMTGADGRLRRTYRDGSARIPAYLDDHAAVCHGLIELALADRRARVARAGPAARRRGRRPLRRRAQRRLLPVGSGRRAAGGAGTRSSTTTRRPSGNSLLAHVLIRLARIYAEPRARGAGRRRRCAWRSTACAARRTGSARCSRRSTCTCRRRARWRWSGPRPIRPPGALADAVRDGFHPTVVYAFGDGADAAGIPLLEGRGPVDGAAAAYICERFACRAPMTDPAAVRAAMAA